jgi:hypothetical protein
LISAFGSAAHVVLQEGGIIFQTRLCAFHLVAALPVAWRMRGSGAAGGFRTQLAAHLYQLRKFASVRSIRFPCADYNLKSADKSNGKPELKAVCDFWQHVLYC